MTEKSDDATPKGCLVSEEEMAFYKKLFPTFDIITKRKIHCTVCRGHLGCAPGKEDNIKMHPVLRVMQCSDCHEFYSSGEFSRGEDGSELYCRWCGQGGQVYCCSSCPYVFCKSCIVENLNKGVVRDIEENDSWNCFSCSTKIIWPLRAMHWALTKYIAKEKEAILSGNHSPAQVQELLAQDNSTCCKTRTTLNRAAVAAGTQKRRATQSPQTTQQPPKKTKSNIPVPRVLGASTSGISALGNNSSDFGSAPPPLVMQNQINKPQQYRIPASIKQTVRPMVPMANRPTTLNRAVGSQSRMMGPRAAGTSLGGGATTIRLSNHMAPTQGPIPRRQISTITATTTNTSGPVYHTINGYRIDLNSASKQDNFRLPNGKLIQVKRQVPVSAPSQPPTQTSTIISSPTPTYTTMNQYIRPPIRTNANSAQQHIIIQRPQTQQAPQQYIIHTPPLTPHGNAMAPSQPIQYRPVPQVQQPTAPQAPIPPGVIGQQNIALKSIPTFVKHIFSSTPLGIARNTLQSQLFHTMEICHHLMTKTHTLTNSNAYKSVHNLMDIKELYIHLSYLLTYAIGRFKGLQEKCLNDMKALGFTQEAKNLEKGQLAKDNLTNTADDDLAIVEPQRDTIELDSDVEDDIPRIKIEKQDNYPVGSGLNMPSGSGYGTSDDDIDLNVAADLLAGMLEVQITEGDPSELRPPPAKARMPRTKTTKRKQRPDSPTTQAERAKIKALQSTKETDAKLKMECRVVLEKYDVPPPVKEKAEEVSKSSTEKVTVENDKTETEDGKDVTKEIEPVKEVEATKEVSKPIETSKEEASKSDEAPKVIEVDSGDDDKIDKSKKDQDDSDKVSVIDLDDDEDDKTDGKEAGKETSATKESSPAKESSEKVVSSETKKPVESEVIDLDDDDENVDKSKTPEKTQSSEVINLDDDEDEVVNVAEKKEDKSKVVEESKSEVDSKTKESDKIEQMEVDEVPENKDDLQKDSENNDTESKEQSTSVKESKTNEEQTGKSDILEISEDEDESITKKNTVDEKENKDDLGDITQKTDNENSDTLKNSPEDAKDVSSETMEAVSESKMNVSESKMNVSESKMDVSESNEKVSELKEDVCEEKEDESESKKDASEPKDESESKDLSESKEEASEAKEDASESKEDVSDPEEISENKEETQKNEGNSEGSEDISEEKEDNSNKDTSEIKENDSKDQPEVQADNSEEKSEEIAENETEEMEPIVVSESEPENLEESKADSKLEKDVEIESPNEAKKSEREIENIHANLSPIKAVEDANGKVYVDGKALEDKDFESSSSSEDEDEETTKDTSVQGDVEMKDSEGKESQSNGFGSENNSTNFDLIESMIKENLSVPASDKNKIEDSSNGLLATTANEA